MQYINLCIYKTRDCVVLVVQIHYMSRSFINAMQPIMFTFVVIGVGLTLTDVEVATLEKGYVAIKQKGCRMVSLAKFRSNFAHLEVSFFHKKLSQSRILKTKEIGETSWARKNMPCIGVSQSLAVTIRYPQQNHNLTFIFSSLTQYFTRYFGIGNVGSEAITKFRTNHTCNKICQMLKLKAFAPGELCALTCSVL